MTENKPTPIIRNDGIIETFISPSRIEGEDTTTTPAARDALAEPLRDKLIRCGWVTDFNADTLVSLIEKHYADRMAMTDHHQGLIAGLISAELAGGAQ